MMRLSCLVIPRNLIYLVNYRMWETYYSIVLDMETIAASNKIIY